MTRFRERPHFTQRERLALEYAEQVIRVSAEVSDALLDRVRRHLPRGRGADFRSKLNSVLRVGTRASARSRRRRTMPRLQ